MSDVGYKLASSVIRDLPARGNGHPDGWPFALKSVLTVAANEANAATGELALSAQKIADLAGCDEKTVRRALDRAIAEGIARERGYFAGKTRRIAFHPVSILSVPDSQPGTPTHDPDPQPGSKNVDPGPQSRDPDSQSIDPDSQPDIKVVHGLSQPEQPPNPASGELPTKPTGNRKRDHARDRAEITAWRDRHFPGADLDAIEMARTHCARHNLDPTPDRVRAWLEKWAPLELAA